MCWIHQYTKKGKVIRKLPMLWEGTCKCFGSEFHDIRPATDNDWLPHLVRGCDGTVNWWLECRCCCDAVFEIHTQCTLRYWDAVPTGHCHITMQRTCYQWHQHNDLIDNDIWWTLLAFIGICLDLLNSLSKQVFNFLPARHQPNNATFLKTMCIHVCY